MALVHWLRLSSSWD